jgi:DMSO/TMAO reductase YedYZ molybdopterin-dependent catalytic subunit
MPKYLKNIFAVIAVLWVAAGHAAEKPNADSQFVTEKVTISGEVEHPLNLTVGDLKILPAQQLGAMPLVCQTGATMSTVESLKGVLLRDVLEKAAIAAKDHNDVKKMVIIAVAKDGYKVVFSWSEIFNSAIGDGVVIFYEKNGQPLGDDEGRIALVSTKDIRTGPRHVKWLSQIEVRKIVE